ncbi:hypothetical protein [Arthrobacter sp. TWP1-1]|uniref:hypothetical protein n=1 Tax=Arthrobacter sp. TWP1-1 TaxID=2804568 RepID=UPI003CEA7754
MVDALTLRGGDYWAGPVLPLMTSLDIEAYPFVEIEGLTRPVAFREATYGVELALLNLARRRLADDKDRSDLFEEAVKRSLTKILPHGVELPYASTFIPIAGTENKGETDFIFRDPVAGTFIGECKAMTAVHAPDTVINSFTDQVGKATKQLRLRMNAVKNGGAVIVDGIPWTAPADDVFGIAVTIHSYGGAVWNHECLPYAEGSHPNIAVMPIHQLLVVVRAMGSASDLAEFIRFRSALLDMNIELQDELDILAAFVFSDAARIRALVDDAPQHGMRVIRAYGVDLNVSLNDTMPTNAEAWQNRLKRTLV